MIALQNVSKTFRASGRDIVAVAPTTLEIGNGQSFGLIGSSGAGKSTLLRLINRLEEPTGGRVLVDGVDITALGPKDLRHARRLLGMVFQSFNLLANRSVLENVTFPLEIAGQSRTAARQRALECLDHVHLADRADDYPAQLSGGQKQRVAIARAIAPKPSALLCDEPTSALDPQTIESVLDTLLRINRDLGVTLVTVTHSMDVVRKLCDAVAVMEDGRVIERIDLRDRPVAATSNLARRLLEPAAAPAAPLFREVAHV